MSVWVALLSLPVAVVFGSVGIALLAEQHLSTVCLGALLLLLSVGTAYVGAMYL